MDTKGAAIGCERLAWLASQVAPRRAGRRSVHRGGLVERSRCCNRLRIHSLSTMPMTGAVLGTRTWDQVAFKASFVELMEAIQVDVEIYNVYHRASSSIVDIWGKQVIYLRQDALRTARIVRLGISVTRPVSLVV
jgi:hypothetical protein